MHINTQQSVKQGAKSAPRVETNQAESDLMDRVEFRVGGDGQIWERDDSPFYIKTAAQLQQFVSRGSTFGGVRNPSYDPNSSEPDGFIPKADKGFLKTIEKLGKESGIEWLNSFKEMGGVNRFWRSHEGFEMSFDNGSPNEILTPEGSYSFGSSCYSGGSREKFMEALEKNFEIETVVAKHPYIPQYSITGPLLRLTPKE